MPGDVHYAVYGDMGFVALLFRNTSISDITYTVVMVDFSGTGALSTTGPLFSVTLPNTVSPPRVMQSFGNGRATFFFSGGSGPTPEARNMMICRSETGDVLLAVGGTISGINGQVIAQVTSTDLVINHPNTGSNDDTSAPRPVGSLTVTPVSHDFGEVVLGASTPGLSTATETFTLGNSGNDCVMVNDIGDVAPFALTAASRASLPITLEPGETTTIDVVFSPASTGNNIMRSLPVTRTPAQGASSLECRGDARNAEASISVSRSSISFGTIPHPGTDVESFTITNSGELDVFVTLPASPAGSFSWAPTNVTLPLPVVGASIDVDVTFTTPGDLAATPQMIVVAPTQGASRTVNLSGAGCIANAVPVLPPSAPITFGEIEQGFRTVRIREVRNDGDGDMVVTARILPGADPTHQDLFGLVLPGADITDAPDMRTYTVNPVTRCGPGPVGDGLETIAVSFFADAAPATGPYTAVLELSTPAPGPTITYNLSATIIPAVPVDAVLAFDKSGSMGATVGTRTKIQAARAAGELFIQMLREDAEDRTSIVSFNETPTDDRSIRLVSGNKPDLISALGFTESGFTNVAGAMTLGRDEFSDPPHPSNPPDLKKALVVLTDGVENRCFQDGGSGPWFSITGRDAADGMARPDGTLQDTDPLPTPGGDIVVHAIGIGEPADVDSATLDQIATATGGAFSLAEDLTGDDFFLLEKYYTQVFMETTGLSPISDPFFTIPAGEKQTHEFDIFPGDVNVMVVIYDHPAGRLPFYVISPLGEVFSGSSLPAGFGMRLRS
ncbi:MAG: choice-of-anchor D domain-containing protein, partial [Pseudomonadota bacterium]